MRTPARARLAVPALALVTLALLAAAGCQRPDWAKGATAPTPAAPAPVAAAAPAAAMAVEGLGAWAVPLIGKNPRTAFPKNGVCRGNADGVSKDDVIPGPATEVYGWGWDVAAGRHVERVILVDEAYVIVGAGDGGGARPDVPGVYPEIPDRATGWRAVTGKASGPVDAFGVVQGGTAICPLGHLVL